MNVLVLGGAGFIGSNIVERLLNDGIHSITIGDIVNEKIKHLVDHPNYRFVKLDITEDSEELENEVLASDVVMNLAAIVHPSLYVSKPLSVFELNFQGNLRVAKLCVEHKKWLVQFSSSEVYGMTAASAAGLDSSEMVLPFNEDQTPLVMGPVCNTRWIYACAKQMMERVLQAYGLEKNLRYTVLRVFNFMGPGIDYLPTEKGGGSPNIVCNIIDSLLYGTKPITLVDGGVATRNYTDIDDGVDFIVKLLADEGRCTVGEIINIGHPGNKISMHDLAQKLCNIFDKHFRKEGDPPRPEIIIKSAGEFYGKGYQDSDKRLPDIGKAKALLGWEPIHDLDRLLYRALEYYVGRYRRIKSDS